MPFLKKTIVFLSASLLGFSLSFSGGKKFPATVRADPPAVFTGKTLEIVLHASARVRGAEVVWQGRSVPFAPLGDGQWRALIGVPVAEVPGNKSVVCRVWTRPEKSWETGVLFTVNGATFPVSRVSLPPQKRRLVDSGQMARDAQTLEAFWKSPVYSPQLWQGAFRFPAEGKSSSLFGSRRSYGDTADRSPHSGTDIANAAGTPIRAPAGGLVVFSGWLDSFGQVVVLNHGRGVFSYYLHMRKSLVAPGQKLAAGDALGEMGSEGVSTGPHLHWSLAVAGVRVDPLQWTEREFR